MLSRRLTSAVLGLALGISSDPSARALEPTTETIDLAIFHYEGVVKVEQGDQATAKRKLDSRLSFRQRDNEQVRVVVNDPNPLLFIYKFEDLKRTETADLQAARTFLERIQTLAGLLQTRLPVESDAEEPESLGAQSDEQRQSPTARFIAQLLTQVNTLSEWASQIDALTRRTIVSRESSQSVKDIVASWNVEATAKSLSTSFEQIDKMQMALLSSTDTPPSATGDQSTFNKDIVSSSPGSGDTLEESLKDNGDSDDGSSNKMQEDFLRELDKIITRPAESIKDLLRQQLKAQQNLDLATVVPTDLQTWLVLLAAKDQEANIRSTLDAVRSFQRTASRIGEPIELAVVDFLAGQQATVKISIEPAEGQAELARESKLKTGAIQIELEPDSIVKLGIGPAAVYSFVELPEFKTQEVDGELRIVRVDDGDELTGTKVAAMLTITPRAWNDSSFGLGFEVGLSPEKNEIGLYGGLSVRLYQLLRLGLGVAYLQTEVLGRGLTEGQVLANASDFKTRTKFEAGFYLSLNLSLGSGSS